MATQYTKRQIPLYSTAPVLLLASNVLSSQRRRAVEKGENPDQFSNPKNRDGSAAKNPDYDYLMVEKNGVIYKFPITLTAANKPQKSLLQEKDKGGSFVPLKFSGMIQPTAALLEDGEPQTMILKHQVIDPDTKKTVVEEFEAPIFEARVQGVYQLTPAATTAVVNKLLGSASESSSQDEDYEEDGISPEEPEEVTPPPRRKKK